MENDETEKIVKLFQAEPKVPGFLSALRGRSQRTPRCKGLRFLAPSVEQMELRKARCDSLIVNCQPSNLAPRSPLIAHLLDSSKRRL
jgi:hypothetical protein